MLDIDSLTHEAMILVTLLLMMKSVKIEKIDASDETLSETNAKGFTEVKDGKISLTNDGKLTLSDICIESLHSEGLKNKKGENVCC